MSALPETAAVHWRPRMDERRLQLIGRSWTASTVLQAAPMLATAILLLFLDPVAVPVGIILLIHAWAIPELYANRGA
jgi:Tfp pilus assembly protein PilN